MSAIIKGYKSGAPNAACNVRTVLLWPLVSIHMYTEGHIIYGCIQQQQLYLAANTDFSPILEMGGLGGSWSEDWRSFVSRAAEEGRHRVGGGRVVESPAHTHTQGQSALCVHGCKISNIHGMASRWSIDYANACFTSLVCTLLQGWSSIGKLRKGYKSN